MYMADKSLDTVVCDLIHQNKKVYMNPYCGENKKT